MVSGTPRRFRLGIEAEHCQIQHVDEGIDRAHWALYVDVVVNASRQERHLLSTQAFDEPCHESPPAHSAGIIKCFAHQTAFSHRLSALRPAKCE